MNHIYIEYNTVIINLLYKVCKSKDIDNNTMKSFIIGTSVDVLIGKINYKMFACKNSCPHRAALLSKGQLKPNDNRIVCYMHCFEYNVFTGMLESIPNKWMNQSQGWKKSGELILYAVTVNEDESVFVDIAEEPISA
jgi:nitrite reductase/ring-hydroxylating ferredoxin subunit